MSILAEHSSHHDMPSDLKVLVNSVAWLMLVISPWAMLALVFHVIGLLSLTFGIKVACVIVVTSALTQVFNSMWFRSSTS